MVEEINNNKNRKKILFLGGFPQMMDIVKKAKDMRKLPKRQALSIL